MSNEILKYSEIIVDKFKPIYEDGNLIKTPLREYLIKNSENLIKNFTKANNDTYSFNIKIETNKKSWIKAENKEDSSLNKKKISMGVAYKTFKELNKELSKEEIDRKFKDVYGYTVKEYEKKLDHELIDWFENKKYFYEFPYIKARGNKAIGTALKNDIIKFLIEYSNEKKVKKEHIIRKNIKNADNYNENNKIISIPTEIIGIQQDNTNRIKLSKNKIKSQYLETSSIVNGDSNTKVLTTRKKYEDKIKKDMGLEISIEELNEKINSTYAYNAFDCDVFLYVTTKAFYYVYKDDSFTQTLPEILKEMGLSNSTQNQQKLKSSLFKLAASAIQKKGQNDNLLAHFFDVYIESEDYKGRKIEKATIWINGFIRSVIKTGNAITFFEDKIQNLSKDARCILFYIQNERIKRAINKSEDTTLYITIEQFKGLIYFTSDRVVKKRLNAALNELKNLIIKDWELVNTTYVINFYKIPQEDLKKITQKDFRKVSYIEKGISSINSEFDIVENTDKDE